MRKIPEVILSALGNDVDYSAGFTDCVERLRALLCDFLRVDMRHEKDMDYSPAQYICFTFHEKVHGSKYSFEVRYYISSKGKLFAVYILDKNMRVTRNGGIGHPVKLNEVPDIVSSMISSGISFMKNTGYFEVENDWFFVPAPGCLTQLDGLQATIFEALFSEIV